LENERLVQLVEKARQGDKSALQELYLDTYKGVFYFALRFVKNPEYAEVITQQVLITVHEKISALREPAAFINWVNQITIDQCNALLQNYRGIAQPDGGGGITAMIPEGDRGYIMPEGTEVRMLEFIQATTLDAATSFTAAGAVAGAAATGAAASAVTISATAGAVSAGAGASLGAAGLGLGSKIAIAVAGVVVFTGIVAGTITIINSHTDPVSSDSITQVEPYASDTEREEAVTVEADDVEEPEAAPPNLGEENVSELWIELNSALGLPHEPFTIYDIPGISAGALAMFEDGPVSFSEAIEQSQRYGTRSTWVYRAGGTEQEDVWRFSISDFDNDSSHFFMTELDGRVVSISFTDATAQRLWGFSYGVTTHDDVMIAFSEYEHFYSDVAFTATFGGPGRLSFGFDHDSRLLMTSSIVYFVQ
jgi:DNA-directed RNA polymerase specialized sigma24 family protein